MFQNVSASARPSCPSSATRRCHHSRSGQSLYERHLESASRWHRFDDERHSRGAHLHRESDDRGGETDGYTLADQLDAIRGNVGIRLIRLRPGQQAHGDSLSASRNARRGSVPVVRHGRSTIETQVAIIERDLTVATQRGKVRHTPKPLANEILELARSAGGWPAWTTPRTRRDRFKPRHHARLCPRSFLSSVLRTKVSVTADFSRESRGPQEVPNPARCRP
jgi:hypothetical protein